MSRIGQMPIEIPQGVTVEVAGNQVTVAGPKGKLTQEYLPEVEVRLEDGRCLVIRRNETQRSRALHGTYRMLIYNMVVGVSQGFEKVLLVNGVGYRAEVNEKNLILNLGYSNPVEYPIPEGVSISVEGNNKITVSSYSKQQLGQVCAEIRSFRPPEPYKGKGIRYAQEIVHRKVGKTGVK